MRPWNHARILPSASARAAVRRDGFARELFVRQLFGSRCGDTALGAVAGAEIGVTHRVASRLVQLVMQDVERRAESAAGIVGGGLDKELVERALPQDAAIHHRVESDATREAQALLTGTLSQIDEDVQHGLLERLLYARGDVVMTLGDLLVGLARAPKTLVIFSGYSRCFAR